MAGTDVRPMRSPISARIALPSGSASSSMTVYLAFMSSRTPLAFMQKGQVVKENINTGLSLMSPLVRAWMASASYSPANDLTRFFLASLRKPNTLSDVLLLVEEAKVFSLRIGAWKALEGPVKRTKTRSVEAMTRKVLWIDIIAVVGYLCLAGETVQGQYQDVLPTSKMLVAVVKQFFLCKKESLIGYCIRPRLGLQDLVRNESRVSFRSPLSFQWAAREIAEKNDEERWL